MVACRGKLFNLIRDSIFCVTFHFFFVGIYEMALSCSPVIFESNFLEGTFSVEKCQGVTIVNMQKLAQIFYSFLDKVERI